MARLLLFDIDMTLITTNRAGRAAIEAAFLKQWGIASALEGIAIDGRTDHAIFMESVALHGLLDGDAEAAYKAASEAYLAELPAAIAERGGSILPGVRELLGELRRTHPAVGLATGNLRRGAAIKLGHFGLWEAFAAGGFGDESPVRADVLRRGAEALASVLECDADPGDAIVIGDTPLDVEAARLAGARVLAVATGRYTVAELQATEADFVAADLADTVEIASFLRS